MSQPTTTSTTANTATTATQYQYPNSSSPIGNIATLLDKVALITGGSSGLGRAIAQAYAAAGAYVVCADLASDAPHAPVISAALKGVDLQTPTVELVNARWPSARADGVERAGFVRCDVTDEESVKGAVGFAVQRYGRLDVMVNSAGVAAEIQAASYNGSLQRIHETDVSILDRTLAVNVRGVWLGTKHAAAQFLSQPGHPVFGHSNPNPNPNPDPDTPSHAEHRGWIINLCSILGSAGSAGVTSYCASKGAVLQLTRAAALEYARDGIHVNCIQPGFTDTQMLENMYGRAEGGKQVVDHLLAALHPWGRTGRAEDIARVAVFLAGEGAGWVTGQGLVVDGGYLAQ